MKSKPTKQKGQHGGVRENAGRFSLFPVKPHKRTFRLTADASDVIDAHAEAMSTTSGRDITASDAVEDIIRKADARG